MRPGVTSRAWKVAKPTRRPAPTPMATPAPRGSRAIGRTTRAIITVITMKPWPRRPVRPTTATSATAIVSSSVATGSFGSATAPGSGRTVPISPMNRAKFMAMAASASALTVMPTMPARWSIRLDWTNCPQVRRGNCTGLKSLKRTAIAALAITKSKCARTCQVPAPIADLTANAVGSAPPPRIIGSGAV